MLNLKEGQNVEFKRELTDTLEREVVSFLNTDGGTLYIGVEDDGKVIGIKEDFDELERKIKDKIKNNIYPQTIGLFGIYEEGHETKTVIKIRVEEGLEKPYYIKKKA